MCMFRICRLDRPLSSINVDTIYIYIKYAQVHTQTYIYIHVLTLDDPVSFTHPNMSTSTFLYVFGACFCQYPGHFGGQKSDQPLSHH